MFEIAETGTKVDKADYEAELPPLRVELLNAQFDLQQAPFPVLIFIVGDDRVGCEELIDLLNEWLDARYIQTHVFEPPSPEENERPPFWRYWRTLPPRGRIGLFRGAWTLDVIAARHTQRIDDAGFDRRVDHIEAFESMLAADGALILKFWIHLPRKVLKQRLKSARKHRDDRWRLDGEDWRIFRHYDELKPLAERYLRKTDTAQAPWLIVEGADKHARDLTVARAIKDALIARLAGPAHAVAPPLVASNETPRAVDVLKSVDLSSTMTRAEYRDRLDRLQARLSRLSNRAYRKRASSVVVLEGWDTAGKGGAIRRLTGAMVASNYQVVPIAAPTDEERAYHYLWRFWRVLPRAGKMLIFDRSWYGRVLVERVEGFASEATWHRAYAEINDFEEQLNEFGIPVVKFWLHIDPDEQARRFEARRNTPYKKYKLTEDDFRNREKWPEYTVAVNEMIARTSTEIAPWHLVAANDKQVARVTVLETVCDALKNALK